jgi:amidohydrolase
MTTAAEPAGWLTNWTADHESGLVSIRRSIHAHPELSFEEFATTDMLVKILASAGLEPRVLPRGTGLTVDIGSGPRTVAVRADIDALPLEDLTRTPYRSTIPGRCHACGHDAHTAIAVGVALGLAELPDLPGRVRVIFQPGEERLPGGALDVMAAGALDGIERIFALHCDPRLKVGRVGTRIGPITAACDTVEVHLAGPGGHTARPHLTVDLIDTLARIAVATPALLARQVDARAGVSLVWGAIRAGEAANAIPGTGLLRGTVRVLDHAAWAAAEKHVSRLITDVASAGGADVDITYIRGVPPVVNDEASTRIMQSAVTTQLGEEALAETMPSMGGEDFAWYGEAVPLAMGRLGVHSGPDASMLDLHQGSFDIDERAIGVGVRVLAGSALGALRED